MGRTTERQPRHTWKSSIEIKKIKSPLKMVWFFKIIPTNEVKLPLHLISSCPSLCSSSNQKRKPTNEIIKWRYSLTALSRKCAKTLETRKHPRFLLLFQQQLNQLFHDYYVRKFFVFQSLNCFDPALEGLFSPWRSIAIL